MIVIFVNWCVSSLNFNKVVMSQFKRVNNQNIFFVIFLKLKWIFCMSLCSKKLCKHFLLNRFDNIISTYNPNCTSVINLVYVYQPKYDTSYILLWMQRKINKGMSESRGVGGALDLRIFFADQITYLKKGSRLCHQHYYRPPSDFQTFRHSCFLSHG